MTDRTDAGAASPAGGDPEEPVAPRLIRQVPPAADAPDGSDARDQEKPRSLWKELPILVVIAVALALLIKTFFLQAFFIPTGSMENTLQVGDRVLVNKLVYDFRDPRRGEVVVFNGNFVDPETHGHFPDERTTTAPGNAIARGIRKITGFLGLGSGDDSDFIKRVIGVGGDTVSCPASATNANVCDHVLVNGKPIDESAYLDDVMAPGQQPFPARKVQPGRLFVMGDHRDNSADSRPLSNTANATVPVSMVVGRAFVVVWPAKRFGTLPVPSTFDKDLSAAGPGIGQTFLLKAGGSAATPPVAGALLALPIVGLRRHRRTRRTRAGARSRTAA